MLSSFPEELIPHWAHELPIAITVTDADAKIIYMNDKSVLAFEQYGNIIGQSLYDCHAPASGMIIRKLLAEGGTNTYTIEKNGIKKLIWQSAWFAKGKISGLVEISIVLPQDMEHHIRG